MSALPPSPIFSSEKVGSYTHQVEPFHVDFKGRLTMGILGNHLLNCAGLHATTHGFGIVTLNEHHHTWVLSRLSIELIRPPMQYEHFTIQTWIENVYRLFTDRNFSITDEKGIPIGYARSVWAMIDVETRKPADLLSLHEGRIADYICDLPCPIEKHSRIKVDCTMVRSRLEPRYGDIDINGHVNSVRYIEHILNLFPLSHYRNHFIQRFEIAYINECYFGEQILFYYTEIKQDEYFVELRKGDGTPICRSRIVFIETIAE